jgi:hypothetical protein
VVSNSGQALALPETPCRADVFHAERDFGQVVRFLENRAYQALTAADKLQRRAQRSKTASAPHRSALSIAGKPAG